RLRKRTAGPHGPAGRPRAGGTRRPGALRRPRGRSGPRAPRGPGRAPLPRRRRGRGRDARAAGRLRRRRPPPDRPRSGALRPEGPPVKITRVETFAVPPRWLLCRVETDDGVVGWGEPALQGRAATVRTAVHELAALLLGRDPLLIEDHWRLRT